MIKNIKFLGKPSREKFNLFVPMGILLLSLGLIDVIINKVNIELNQLELIFIFNLSNILFPENSILK